MCGDTLELTLSQASEHHLVKFPSIMILPKIFPALEVLTHGAGELMAQQLMAFAALHGARDLAPSTDIRMLTIASNSVSR